MRQRLQILPQFLEAKLPVIQKLCRKHKIKRLWAFGSVLRGDLREDSDIDLLHEWDEPNITDEEYLDNHDNFLDTLGKILEKKIDFVHYPSLKNPYFIQEIERTKVLLYAQKPEEVSV